jgi:hypothetical protein
VSRWLYHDQQRSSFADFVVKAHISEQNTYGGDLKPTLFWRTAEQVNWFIRYETLHPGLNALLKHIGAPTIKELPVVGKSEEKPDWRQLWSRSLEVYARQFFPDVRRYNYWGTISPSWRWSLAATDWGRGFVKPKLGD